jgi:hypothetical protein
VEAEHEQLRCCNCGAEITGEPVISEDDLLPGARYCSAQCEWVDGRHAWEELQRQQVKSD